ncbi:aspartyl protease family protein [Aquimarina gracilis]|uniref:Aspartyl protease family protein n=1 Tax=Aquimarina gracilis TaxID=874422 RepID=A0ABU6A0E6_9FLAO|nr:aspartyl protease family protein [Aquimarina gracilis]MEB3347557.1 aspartyl protease family protein [Aquimarina gracilis]
MRTLIKIAPFILLLTSCGGSKLENLLKSGNIASQEFSVTIPFEYKQGLMVIKATINDKEYDFILDTGASNVLSKELHKELGLKILDSEVVYGAHGTGQELEYTKVNTINIGGVDFQNTIAAIHDLNAVTEIACMDVDGIIGANLMRQAVWDFDFKNQKITITNAETSLDIPANHKEVKFFVGYQGTPSIITTVNGMRVLNNRIDTGYTGSLSLSRIEFQKLRNKNKLAKYVTGNGSASVGVYGAGKPTVFYRGLVDNMRFGNLELDNTVISFSGANSKLIGINFLKKYRVIFNWNTQRIKLIETQPYKNTTVNTYGFGPSFKEDKLYIKYIIEGSSAQKNGLEIGDQILAIDDADYTTITQNQWCTTLKNGLVDASKKAINITIQRDSVINKLNVDKTIVLQ